MLEAVPQNRIINGFKKVKKSKIIGIFFLTTIYSQRCRDAIHRVLLNITRDELRLYIAHLKFTGLIISQHHLPNQVAVLGRDEVAVGLGQVVFCQNVF